MLKTLAFGDLAFLGKGPHDEPWPVGVELKHVAELLPPARDRFATFQLPGLRRAYRTVVVIVEDVWRLHAESGTLEMPRGAQWKRIAFGKTATTFHAFDQFLLDLACGAGVIVLVSRGPRETAARIVS